MTAQVQEAEGEEKLNLDEESMKALEELVEVAVYLKRSGILDMLRIIAEKGMDLLAMISNDPAIYRAMTVVDAASRGMLRLHPEEVISAKMNLEKISECTLRSLASADPAKAKPVGLFGLLGALSDKNVQKGLGLLIEVARNLGACTSRGEG